MSTVMGYEPYYPTASSFSGSSSSSNFRRWYAEVTTPTPQVGFGARRGRTEAHSAYSSHASPLSSSTRLRYSSSPHRGGRIFQSSASSAFSAASSSTLDRELSQAAQISSQFREVRTQERAQLQELNDRFAGFVERVHDLELQNRSLEAELDALRRRHHAQPHRLGALYEQEARALRAAVEQVQAERQEALGRRESLERALGDLEARRREEELGRQETEVRLLELRGEADEAALARAEAEKRTEALLDELAFLKKIHEEEVSDLQAQAQLQARVQAEIEGEAAGTIAPDLSGALRDIRAQYEGLAAKNVRSAEEWFRGKVGTLNESVAQHSHAARTSKDEAGEVRSQLQTRLLDIDACRGVNCSLEKQLEDVEERQAAEVAALQDLIVEIEGELGSTKQEMTGYLKDYQDLLNVKMALDIEIAAYRKLLEGEESRFSRVGTAGGASSAVQYRSHSVSAVAPPSFTRPMFAPVLRSGGSYLATSRVHLGSTFVASRSHKVKANPQPEEEEEKEKEEEEVEVKEKVEGGDEDKEEDKEEEEKEEGKGDDEDKEESEEKGGEGGDEEEEKPEMTEDAKEGAEKPEETKETEEEEVVTEDKKATEQVVEKEVSGDKDKGDKKGEEDKKEVEKAKEEETKKKTEQEDEVKPEMKAEKEGGKEKQESEPPREESKKEEAATEKTKK